MINDLVRLTMQVSKLILFNFMVNFCSRDHVLRVELKETQRHSNGRKGRTHRALILVYLRHFILDIEVTMFFEDLLLNLRRGREVIVELHAEEACALCKGAHVRRVAVKLL